MWGFSEKLNVSIHLPIKIKKRNFPQKRYQIDRLSPTLIKPIQKELLNKQFSYSSSSEESDYCSSGSSTEDPNEFQSWLSKTCTKSKKQFSSINDNIHNEHKIREKPEKQIEMETKTKRKTKKETGRIIEAGKRTGTNSKRKNEIEIEIEREQEQQEQEQEKEKEKEKEKQRGFEKKSKNPRSKNQIFISLNKKQDLNSQKKTNETQTKIKENNFRIEGKLQKKDQEKQKTIYYKKGIQKPDFYDLNFIEDIEDISDLEDLRKKETLDEIEDFVATNKKIDKQDCIISKAFEIKKQIKGKINVDPKQNLNCLSYLFKVKRNSSIKDDSYYYLNSSKMNLDPIDEDFYVQSSRFQAEEIEAIDENEDNGPKENLEQSQNKPDLVDPKIRTTPIVKKNFQFSKKCLSTPYNNNFFTNDSDVYNPPQLKKSINLVNTKTTLDPQISQIKTKKKFQIERKLLFSAPTNSSMKLLRLPTSRILANKIPGKKSTKGTTAKTKSPFSINLIPNKQSIPSTKFRKKIIAPKKLLLTQNVKSYSVRSISFQKENKTWIKTLSCLSPYHTNQVLQQYPTFLKKSRVFNQKKKKTRYLSKEIGFYEKKIQRVDQELNIKIQSFNEEVKLRSRITDPNYFSQKMMTLQILIRTGISCFDLCSLLCKIIDFTYQLPHYGSNSNCHNSNQNTHDQNNFSCNINIYNQNINFNYNPKRKQKFIKKKCDQQVVILELFVSFDKIIELELNKGDVIEIYYPWNETIRKSNTSVLFCTNYIKKLNFEEIKSIKDTYLRNSPDHLLYNFLFKNNSIYLSKPLTFLRVPNNKYMKDSKNSEKIINNKKKFKIKKTIYNEKNINSSIKCVNSFGLFQDSLSVTIVGEIKCNNNIKLFFQFENGSFGFIIILSNKYKYSNLKGGKYILNHMHLIKSSYSVIPQIKSILLSSIETEKKKEFLKIKTISIFQPNFNFFLTKIT
ncbi:hypothetical protein M0813_28977 [Anaeramoeba flamelloides]|uniref:Uncharacterized protein n=1 Tax=Anaeramoeba flamelloides TaxID=1746091 RepID=A0ABQ8XQV7_9EUKA|nr:hypothetical protein M0813_28977 [Anaeramoeba flamelloides]